MRKNPSRAGFLLSLAIVVFVSLSARWYHDQALTARVTVATVSGQCSSVRC